MASHAHRYPSLDLPRPLHAAWPLLVLAAATLALVAAPELPLLLGLAGAACFAVAAAVRAERARHELAVVRRTADRLIARAPRTSEASELVEWRARELTSRDSRDALRRELARMLRQLDPRRLPSASPLRRAPARRNEELLRAIAARLGDERPVAARGIVLVRQLLREPGSPLYAEDGEALLVRALVRALGALEP